MTYPRRLPYPDMDNLTPEQIELRRIMGPRRGGPNATRLMKMLVNFPIYGQAIRSLGARTADNNSLPPRLYQIACMRASWLCDAEYLWSQHRTASLALGITDEELYAVAAGPTNTVLKGLDQQIVVAIDELHFDHRYSDASWTGFDEPLGPDAKLDILMTHAIFVMQANLANSTGVDLEDGVPGFSEDLLALRAEQRQAGQV
ncbi:carboxymuconolactone decarboxylase family protein [Brevundimonas goettingensis]|uniref:Carboxymuconolactone decarboxylase family protein n=1 Tax=Brevundimonas goettingensis TaxID=2774190 RepID=A0A975GVX6_9CAUL|nr:carboxymuconolactone decarboxylase family protein [Brevundimonas goettingensis]QTC91932.1 carboxymuconolactone decarboxylase family protein [Brevundimonas goettingensis]